MLRLILPIVFLPDGQEFCKPTGQKKYVKCPPEELKTGGGKNVCVDRHQVILIKSVEGSESLNLVPFDSDVAVDFENLCDLHYFVGELCDGS